MDFNLDFKLPQDSRLAAGEEDGQIFEVAILGGGPAGMTAAVYTSRKQLSTVLISPDLGGQVLTTSGVENYMGFQYVTGPKLAIKFSGQIQQFPIKLAQGERAVRVIEKENMITIYTDADREVKCRTLIIATGKSQDNYVCPAKNSIGDAVFPIVRFVMGHFLKRNQWLS